MGEIDGHEILSKGRTPGDECPVCAEDRTPAVKDQVVVSADEVYCGDWDPVVPCGAGERLLAPALPAGGKR